MRGAWLALVLVPLAASSAPGEHADAKRESNGARSELLEGILSNDDARCREEVGAKSLRRFAYEDFAAWLTQKKDNKEKVEPKDLLRYSHMLFTMDYQSSGNPFMMTGGDGVHGWNESMKAGGVETLDGRLAKWQSRLASDGDLSFGLLKIPRRLLLRAAPQIEILKKLTPAELRIACKLNAFQPKLADADWDKEATYLRSCDLKGEPGCTTKWSMLCPALHASLFDKVPINYFNRRIASERALSGANPAAALCMSSLVKITGQIYPAALPALTAGLQVAANEIKVEIQRGAALPAVTRQLTGAGHRADDSSEPTIAKPSREQPAKRTTTGRARSARKSSTLSTRQGAEELSRVAYSLYKNQDATNSAGNRTRRCETRGKGKNARVVCYCFVYVKNALLRAGIVDHYLDGATAIQAHSQGILKNEGFTLLSTQDPLKAPAGAVIVYRAFHQPYGHIELKTADGRFVSNVNMPKPMSVVSPKHRDRDGDWVGYEVAGIYIKE